MRGMHPAAPRLRLGLPAAGPGAPGVVGGPPWSSSPAQWFLSIMLMSPPHTGLVDRVQHVSKVAADPGLLRPLRLLAPTGRSTSTGQPCNSRPILLDHILVHELAHLHRPDHSPEFWRLI